MFKVMSMHFSSFIHFLNAHGWRLVVPVPNALIGI